MSKSIGRTGWDTVDTDVLVKVSAADTTADYLNPKISGGTGITTAILNPGANEQLEVSLTPGAYVSGSGTTGTIPKFTAATVLGDSIITESASVITVTGDQIITGLTANQAVFTDGSKQLVSNAITGTGNVAMSASPTFTGTILAAAATLSGNLTLSGLTADRLVETNGSSVVSSLADLTDYIAGGTDISVVDDGDGTVTINYTGGASISGSGSTNQLAKFTGATAIGDSAISDNGSVIIIGSGVYTVSVPQDTTFSGDVFFSAQTADRLAQIGSSNEIESVNLSSYVAAGTGMGIVDDGSGGITVNWSSSGTTDVIPKWTGANALGDSLLKEDSNGVFVNASAKGIGIGVGGASDSIGVFISTSNTLGTATSQAGAQLTPTFSSSATTSATGLSTGITTQAASFTVTNAYGVRVLAPTIGVGSAITNLYGLRIENQAGGSNNFSIWAGTGDYHFDATTADQLLQTDSSKNMVSVANLTNFIAGGTDISVVDDGDGTVTLNYSGLSGTGTTNRIPVYTGASTIGDGYFLQSAGAVTLDADKALNISTTGNGTYLELKSTTAGATSAWMTWRHDTASPANNDELGRLNFDLNSADIAYVIVKADVPTISSEETSFNFYAGNGSTIVNSAIINGSGLNLPLQTASLLLQTDASKNVTSVANLTAWIAGGTDISVVDDGDGTVTVNYTGSATMPRLDQVLDPNTNKSFTMGNNTLEFVYSAPVPGVSSGAFAIEATGNFNGDLIHVHQLTGSPITGSKMLYVETTDTDVIPLDIEGGDDCFINLSADKTVNINISSSRTWGGTEIPYLYIQSAAAGYTPTLVGNDFVIESSTDASMTLVTGATATASIYFQWGATENDTLIQYDANTGLFNFDIGGTTEMSLAATGLTVTNLLTCATFKLTTSPTNGYVLTSDASGNGTWQAASGGSPAGSDTQVQYNNGGAFGGASALTYNDTTGNVTIAPTTNTNGIFIDGNTGNIDNPRLRMESNSNTAEVSGTIQMESANGNFTWKLIQNLSEGLYEVKVNIDAAGEKEMSCWAEDYWGHHEDGTDSAFRVGRYTQTQINNLTASNGMIVYNSTDGEFNIRQGGVWEIIEIVV